MHGAEPGDLAENESEELLQKRRSSTIVRLRQYLARQSGLLGHYGRPGPDYREAMARVEQDIQQALAELDALHDALGRARTRDAGHRARDAGHRARAFVIEQEIPRSRRNSREYLELILLRHCAADHADIAHVDRHEALALLQQLIDDDLLRRTWRIAPSETGGLDGEETIERTERGSERLAELERMLKI